MEKKDLKLGFLKIKLVIQSTFLLIFTYKNYKCMMNFGFFWHCPRKIYCLYMKKMTIL